MVKTGIGKPRVLIIEDDAISREILTDLLKMAGYEVVSAPSGEQALLVLVRERGRLDCLFTAIELSGLVDGWMVADEFRGANPDRRIVFATAATPPTARGGTGDVFIGRPALPPKVVEAVNAATGQTEAVLRSRRSPPRVVVERTAPRLAETPRPRKLRRAHA